MFNDPQTKTSMKRIAWVGGAFLTIMLIAAAVERKKEMTVVATVVEVEPLENGALLIDSLDVIKLVERSFGMPLDEQAAGLIDEDRVERVLEEDPFVKNAEVLLTANSRIKINIEQRQPILRVMDNLGAQYYLDSDGARVPLSKHFAARTLVATGNIPPHTPEFLTKKNHPMKDLFELTNFILNDPFWKALFEQIYVNSRNEFVLVPKVGDQTVILGKWDSDVEDKFRRLKIFYEEGMSREGWQKYHSIDLRYRGQVVCERK
jgi:cell division protein FtsQ